METKVMEIPQCVLDRYEKLVKICNEHVNYIPVEVVAEYYGITTQALRNMINSGNCTFAINTAQTTKPYSRQFYVISMYAFYMFETQGMLNRQRLANI